ncbi:hypothetical protein MRB53_041330 [Persea americana]|nr:hypothetical protein MRB53_041330 [Persea americana]
MSKTTIRTTPRSNASITSRSRISTAQWPSQLQKRPSTDDEGSDGGSSEDSVDGDDINDAETDGISDDNSNSGDERAKDQVEEELERLVFGDRAGFRAGLKDFNPSEDQNQTTQQNDLELENITDAELFFTDINPDEGLSLVPSSNLKESNHDTTLQSAHPTVWEDSDDERMQVSLATATRLRKLRHTEAEDIVNGVEYSRRLRQQFELLHPTPRWALDAIQRPARKKRRLSDDNSDSDAERSVDDMDIDAENAVAPLSQLLQDAAALVRTARSGNGKKRKLRPERHKSHDHLLPSYHLTYLSRRTSTILPRLEPHHRTSRKSPHGCTANNTSSRVWNASFSPDGRYMALLGSTRKGGGVINLLDSTTLQWTSQVRIDSRHGIADFAWWHDGHGLCIAGKNGEITEWSATEQRVIARWQDEGAVGTTVLALGGTHDIARSPFGADRWIAIGSSSGIVNIYDRRAWLTPNAGTTEQAPPSLATATTSTSPSLLTPNPSKPSTTSQPPPPSSPSRPTARSCAWPRNGNATPCASSTSRPVPCSRTGLPAPRPSAGSRALRLRRGRSCRTRMSGGTHMPRMMC